MLCKLRPKNFCPRQNVVAIAAAKLRTNSRRGREWVKMNCSSRAARHIHSLTILLGQTDRESGSTPVLLRNAKIGSETKHSGYALVITSSISKPAARVCVSAFAPCGMPYSLRRCLIRYAKLARNCIALKTVAAAHSVPFRFLVALKCGSSRKHN